MGGIVSGPLNSGYVPTTLRIIANLVGISHSSAEIAASTAYPVSKQAYLLSKKWDIYYCS